MKDKEWFKKAMRTTSGQEYVVDPICIDPSHDRRMVATYATAVRSDGQIRGRALGTLGVYFDWEEQSRVIVEDEPNLSEQEWEYSKVMLVDARGMIIASSDRADLLNAFSLQTKYGAQGAYINEKNQLVAYAKTLGYQEYDGLGWYGVIIQDR